MLKTVQAVIALFVLPFTFAFGDEVCDQTDKEWSILTNSVPAPSSSHWLVHDGIIIRKDILEKQQLPAFRYISAWKAFEETIISRYLTIPVVSPKPVIPSGINEIPSANISEPDDRDTCSSENKPLIDDLSSSWEGISLPQKKEFVPMNIFHWHLSADENNPDLPKRMDALLANIVKHLTKEKLMPDIFSFTGTNSITGKEAIDQLSKYSEKLCKILLEYRLNREPDTEECQMIKLDLKTPYLGKHNIFWTEHMLVISMLPAKPFLLRNYEDYESCSLDDENQQPYASYLFLDAQYDNYIVPLMFFSSLDNSIEDMMVDSETWISCSNDLKRAADSALDRSEALVIISHINAPYFSYRDFARQWSAIARNTDGKIKELSLKNPLATSFFQRYSGIGTKARRFSAVLSYRHAMADMEQPARAHMTPDDVYLDFPGTRQKFLKWQGYSPFHPSYTKIRLNKAHLSTVWKQ